jgi:hypothetical protein
VLAARYLLSCVDYSPLASTPVVEEAVIEVTPIERKEVSREVVKQIEVFAKGGGKTSKPDLDSFIEALKLCGFNVEYGSNWILKINSALYSYEISKAFFKEAQFGNKLYIRNPYSSDDELYFQAKNLQELIDKKLICLSSNSEHIVGTIEVASMSEIEHGANLESILVDKANFIVPTLIITAPNGAKFEAKLRSDYLFICPTAWKFLYQNDLDKAAKKIIEEGIDEPLSDKEILEMSRAGMCPVCLRYIERRDDGAIMRHGWRSRMYSQVEPPCFGWKKPPWEKSPLGAIQYLELIKNQHIPSLQKELHIITEQPPSQYPNREWLRHTQQYRHAWKIKQFWIRDSEDHKKWEAEYKGHIAEVKSEITYAESIIPVIKKRIAEWKEQPFWFEVNAEKIKQAAQNIRVGKGGRI